MFFIFLKILLYSSFVSAKYQVCSITINSSDEIETFKEFLSPQDFDFLELLPSEVNELQDHSDHWFNLACEQDYKCDILIISGHFGGTFFGKSGYALPTELLEEKACQKNCGGILSDVKEIFLFGCNTMASKKTDFRSYTDYLQVLLDHGMARETAERVVAARYSPLESPFYARMNFIFSGSHTIYGFDQLSPLGEHIREPLRKYLQSINKNFNSYANYLRTEKYKRPRNIELFQQLPSSVYTLNQAHISLSGEDSQSRKFFSDKCALYDDAKNFNERMSALENIFLSQNSGKAFFAVDHFIDQNKIEVIEGKGRKTFRSIRVNEDLKEEFLSYYEHLNSLPYIRITYLNVLEKFQWVGTEELTLRMKQELLALIRKPDPESYISLLLLLNGHQVTAGNFYISKSDLPEGYIKNIWGLLIFEKLKVIAPDWQSDILKYCEDNLEETPALCYQVLNTLAHISPTLKTAQASVKFLDSKDEGLAYYTIRMLGQSKIDDYSIHKKIASFLTHKNFWMQKEALETLSFLKSPYPDVQEDMSYLLLNGDQEIVETVFSSFNRMDINSELSQRRVIQRAIQSADKDLIQKAVFSFQNTSQFFDFTLSFLYEILESKNKIETLLPTVSMLSQNKKMKDLGIHYRFLAFQKEKSLSLKREVLKRMSALEWLHPEVQVNFLNYLIDEDPVVRKQLVDILRNINNLQDKTLNQIQILYKEQNIQELKKFFDFYSVK